MRKEFMDENNKVRGRIERKSVKGILEMWLLYSKLFEEGLFIFIERASKIWSFYLLVFSLCNVEVFFVRNFLDLELGHECVMKC